MAKSEEPEPERPRGISAPGPQPVALSGRRRAVFEGLVSFGPTEGPRQPGPIYLGVLGRLAEPEASDCAAHAAHGARELMEKLAWWVNDQTPEEGRGSLGDRANEIEDAYREATEQLPPDRARWAGAQMAPGVLRMLDAVEHMAEWRRDHTLEPGDYAVVMVDFCLGQLPEQLRIAKRKEWRELRDFFTAVSHHRPVDGTVATPADVKDRFAALEGFLYARWAPEAVRDFAEIDALINPEGAG